MIAKKDCYSDIDKILFVTNEQNDYEKFASVEENKLNLSTSNCLQDGGSAIYKKIQ